MADLRIVDAPLLSTVKGTEKLPTGGEGNFSVSVNQVADFAKLKWVLATEGYADNAVGNVQADLNLHKNNTSNPHDVTKVQVGLGNVDNTADADKPVSNSTQAAIITANSGKADKSYVDSQDQLKADKVTTYTKTEVDSEFLSIYKNGAALPYDATMEYEEGAVVVKDGELQKKQGASWVSATNKGYNLDYFVGGKSYPLHAEIMLANGDIVKSTIADNTANPNVDMAGWVLSGNSIVVESIADLLAIQNPKDGDYIFVKSYHLGLGKGGGVFVYDSTKANINNTGTIIGGWVRLYSGAIHFDWFGCKADGVFDDWDAINNAINSKASTAYLSDWNNTSIRTTGSFEFSEGIYRITKPILLPPYTRIKGAGNRWYFAGETKYSNTTIKPDFTDIYNFAFQSANYVTATGQLIGVDQNYTGSLIDSKSVTSTLGIQLSDMTIEPVSKILGAIRLVGSARSRLSNIHVTNVDMGVVMNSSWSSYVDVTTQHDKVGLLIGWSCNNCEVRGYYTGTTKAVLPNNFWRNHLDGVAASYGLSSDALNTDVKFGIFARYNQGTYLPNIVCEGNDYSVGCVDGDFVINAIYSEKAKKATFLTYQSDVSVGNTTGGLDQHILDVGYRSTFDLQQYNQLYIPNLNLIRNLGRSGTSVTVPNNFNHIIPHVYTKNEVRKIYVDSTMGNDFNVGESTSPLKTIDAAMQRASIIVSPSDSFDKVVISKEIVIVDSSTYSINTDVSLSGNIKVSSTQATRPKLIFNKQWYLENCNLFILGVGIERSAVTYPTSQNGCFLAADGFSSITIANSGISILQGGLINETYLTSGILSINIRNSTVTGSAETQVYGNHTGGDTVHGVNLISKGVTYTGGIQTRSDKGYVIPTANRGLIVGIALT